MNDFDEKLRRLVREASEISGESPESLLDEIKQNSRMMGLTDEKVSEALKLLQPSLPPKLISDISCLLAQLDSVHEKYRRQLDMLSRIAAQGDLDELTKWTYTVVAILKFGDFLIGDLDVAFEQLRNEIQKNQ